MPSADITGPPEVAWHLDPLSDLTFVSTARRPQFFLPMALHRALGSAPLARALEGGAREEFKHGKGKPLDPEQMYQAMQTTLREDIRYSNKAIGLPRWSPRMAIGVYTAGCNVSIKNFTITPLSPAL